MKSLPLLFVTGMVVALPGCSWFKPSEDANPPHRGASTSPTTNWMAAPATDGTRWTENIDEREKREKLRR